MENFQQKFIEEANDLINELEITLLALEDDPQNNELVEKVFRVMHSLKGGGAMFGFERISEFTHHLESIYDQVRTGKTTISKELLDITLKSVDHLKLLLKTGDIIDENLEQKHELLTRQVIEIVEAIEEGNYNEKNEQAQQENDKKQEIENQTSPTLENNSGLKTYHIFFEPNPDIFDNGTNPLYLLDELFTLGECTVFPRLAKIPDLTDYNPTTCYIFWDIFLATEDELNSITDVFIFVEDDCKLDIHELGPGNLLHNEQFNSHIQQYKEKHESLSINHLKEFVDSLHHKSKSKEQQSGYSFEKVKQKEAPAVNNLREHSISSIRVSSDKLDYLMNLVSELVTTQARLSLYAEQKSQDNEILSIAEDMQKLSRQLRDNAFDICLIPVENMLTRFKRLVRDLSTELNKEINFVTEGTDTELDKTIIESLVDPILHILRNSVDHGIESTEERLQKGKPAQGKILFRAYYSGATVNIEITDDGQGIDAERIKEKAINKGLLSPEAQPSKQEILNMIFLPGLSTAQRLTDVSGRGVGMDVVKRKIEEVRGEVEIHSQLDKGTTTIIKLPITLSIIDGLLVKIAQTFFVIPLQVIDKIYDVPHEQLINTFNNIIVLDGKQYPFLYLRQEFDMPEADLQNEEVLVVSYEGKQIGLAVDIVEGEYQAVLKPLGKFFKNQEFISGATILGDGTVALVMDTNKIIKNFTNTH